MTEKQTYPGTPRWVKIASIVVAVVTVAAVLHLVFGGGVQSLMQHSMPGMGSAAPVQGSNG